MRSRSMKMVSGTFMVSALVLSHSGIYLRISKEFGAPRGGGGTPRIGWGCAARFPKPLPYL